MKANYLATIAAPIALFWMVQSAAQAPSLPSQEDFDRALKACNNAQQINIASNILESLSKLYSSESARQVLRSPSEYLLLIPEDKRIDAYRLYAECITKIVPQIASATIPTPQMNPTRYYKICTGEYERACQPHDVYLYCGVNPEIWARDRCTTYSIQQLNSYGGNKCGYGLLEVQCNGPKFGQ
jgi:hypothetical protein